MRWEVLEGVPSAESELGSWCQVCFKMQHTVSECLNTNRPLFCRQDIIVTIETWSPSLMVQAAMCSMFRLALQADWCSEAHAQTRVA